MGNDSLLQNNVECDASIGWEEVKMDCVNETVAQNRSACWEEHVTSACPPNLNNNVAVGDVSVEISGRDSSPTKGLPAREFLQTLVLFFFSVHLFVYSFILNLFAPV